MTLTFIFACNDHYNDMRMLLKGHTASAILVIHRRIDPSQ
jgi:hypothetical protein